jgi:hypothetical protein
MMIPMLKTVELSKAATKLQDFAHDPDQPAVILVVKGKPVAVVLPVHGADVETISVSVNPGFQEIMRRSDERCCKEGGISHEEVLKQFGLSPSAKPKSRKPRTRSRKSNGARNGGQV